MTRSYVLGIACLTLVACSQADENNGQAQAPEVVSAKSKTVETVVMCEQGDGDQYKSVGIALNDGPGLAAYVVEHNVDDDSHKLAQTTLVSATKQGEATVYSDAKDTFKLTVTPVPKSDRLVGTLSILEDGPGGTLLSGLDCYEKTSLTFDTNTVETK